MLRVGYYKWVYIKTGDATPSADPPQCRPPRQPLARPPPRRATICPFPTFPTPSKRSSQRFFRTFITDITVITSRRPALPLPRARLAHQRFLSMGRHRDLGRRCDSGEGRPAPRGGRDSVRRHRHDGPVAVAPSRRGSRESRVDRRCWAIPHRIDLDRGPHRRRGRRLSRLRRLEDRWVARRGDDPIHRRRWVPWCR